MKLKQLYNVCRDTYGCNMLEAGLFASSVKIEEGLKRVYNFVGPEIEVDNENKTYSLKEKCLFSNLTEAYFTLRGFKRV